jgi:site-specific DNA-methyltransferase (adenine-specific)
MSFDIRHGDCREVMQTLHPDSVDSIVSDPPYGLSAAKNSGKSSRGGFMGKEWDHGVPGVEFWTEALRVAKPGAHLLAFGGTRTYHRLACAIEDAGWEIRDCISWVYASGFPKSHNLKGQWAGWGTSLKPAWEPVIVARKPLCGTVAENVLAHGTGGINVEGCRVAFASEADERESKDKNAHAKFGTQPGGNDVYGDYSMVTPTNYNPPGRWPANFIHDGSDEVVGLFPGNVKGGTWNRTTGARHFNNDGEPTEYQTSGSDASTGSAARFFYCPKASKADRDEGCEGLPQTIKQSVAHGDKRHGTLPYTNEPREMKPRPRGNHHPTVKPTALMRYLCRLVTPPGGVVLDPFMGSGSTGKAAIMEGFRFIGIEREAEYVEIAKARIGAAEPGAGPLFAG